MILDRSFPRSATFTHSSPSTKFRQTVRDFHRCPSRFGAAINFIFKATRAGLLFIIETEHSVDDRNAAFQSDTLECVSDRPAEILRVIRFALQDHSARNNGVGFVLTCKFAYDDRDLERTGDAMDGNSCVWRKRRQLVCGVIDKAIHELRIKPARDNLKRAFGFGRSRTRWRFLRHSSFGFRHWRRPKAGAPASSFLFGDTFRCADWHRSGSAPARSFPTRSPPNRRPSWDYS